MDARDERFFEDIARSIDGWAEAAVHGLRDPASSSLEGKAGLATLAAAVRTPEQRDTFEAVMRETLTGLAHADVNPHRIDPRLLGPPMYQCEPRPRATSVSLSALIDPCPKSSHFPPGPASRTSSSSSSMAAETAVSLRMVPRYPSPPRSQYESSPS